MISLVLVMALSLMGLSLGADPIASVSVWPRSVFPVELGESVTWLFTPQGGAEYNTDSVLSFTIEGAKVYRVQKNQCTGPQEKYFTCIHKAQNEIAVTFTPTEDFYGKEISITYYINLDAIWEAKDASLYKEKIELTKQPTFINMKMELIEASRYATNIPTELRLEPPVFITGSNVRIDCDSDGSLPPVPVRFSIECPPPPIAVVEHDRVTQAKQRLSYERFYYTYGFRHAPTLSDLAPYVARKHANQLLRLGNVVSSKDNKTIRATLLVTEKAHDCHVVCRVAGKETRRRMTVYYPTTIAYLLPRPRDGLMQVGSEITCYADGHPPPMLSLRLAPPLRPPKPLTREELDTLQQSGHIPRVTIEDPISREQMFAQSGLDFVPDKHNRQPGQFGATDDRSMGSSATLEQIPPEERSGSWFNGNGKEPFETARRIPGIGLSPIARHRQLGLLPYEYSIQGATFSLAPNATPGSELLLTCTARNVLPGDTTFLGLNGTITRSRFVVSGFEYDHQTSAKSYASLTIAASVCAFLLLIIIIVIVAMLLQKRRQAANGGVVGSKRMPANGGGAGANKAKAVARQQYTQGQPTRSTIIAQDSQARHTFDMQPPSMAPSVHQTGAYSYEPDPDINMTRAGSLSYPPHMDGVQYAQLNFDHHVPQVAAAGPMGDAYTTPPRSGMPRGGPISASMTLVGGGHMSPRQPISYGPAASSVPHGLDYGAGMSQSPHQAGPQHLDDTSSHYTEIVAVMQPKAHSSQLVLQQQQEATHVLLAMQQNKPRVFV